MKEDTLKYFMYVLCLIRKFKCELGSDLEILLEFIDWCELSMIFDDKYTEKYVVNLLVHSNIQIKTTIGYDYYIRGGGINLEPVFKYGHARFINTGVNIAKFKKCVAVICKFRSDIYMSMFSDILAYKRNIQIRYKKLLFDAAQCGDLNTVCMILENRYPIIPETYEQIEPDKIVNDDILMALKVATWNEHNDIVQILMFHADTKYSTLIYFALLHDNIDIAHLLLNAKTNIDEQRGHPGYRYSHTALHFATANNDYHIVESLINLNADVNIISDSMMYHYTSSTTLDTAIIKSSIDIVELLIKSKAHVDATDESLKTPLHTATRAGNVGIVKLLLDAKSDFNAASMGPSPNTPLQIARERGYDEILMLFN